MPDRRRPLHRARDTGGDATRLRCRRRRARRPAQRPYGVGRVTQPVRRRGIRQDRDRLDHLVAGAWGGARRDLLGPAPRSVDAQPGADPAGSRHHLRHGRRPDARGGRRDLPGGPVPAARGRRHPVPGRPLGLPDHGEDADPRDVGARAAAHHRGRRTPWPHLHGEPRPDRLRRRVGRRRAGCCLRELHGGGHQDARSGGHLAPGVDHRAARPRRFPVLRGRAHGVRRGDPGRR